jgi:hypothetical protein
VGSLAEIIIVHILVLPQQNVEAPPLNEFRTCFYKQEMQALLFIFVFSSQP